MKLLLFDIDGTLVGSRSGIGRRVLEEAIRCVTGRTVEIPLVLCAGRTDPYIVDETLASAGITAGDGIRDAVLAEYVRTLQPLYRYENGVFVHGGARRILDALRERSEILLGLLTGNLQEGARIKLEAVGLWEYFRLGAFGSDARERDELPPIAMFRAEKVAGHAFDPRSVYIIGDTVHDVRAGQAHGLVTIAVGNHPQFVPEIQAAGPDHFLTSLDDFGGFMRAVER
ncbi:MAG: HAD family hydrolase [Acidobacteria bacterium]|nr:HAD family hydrolase [Acidobacteriota bacterium]